MLSLLNGSALLLSSSPTPLCHSRPASTCYPEFSLGKYGGRKNSSHVQYVKIRKTAFKVLKKHRSKREKGGKRTSGRVSQGPLHPILSCPFLQSLLRLFLLPREIVAKVAVPWVFCYLTRTARPHGLGPTCKKRVLVPCFHFDEVFSFLSFVSFLQFAS